MDEPVKRRRSNFDITPEQVVTQSFAGQSSFATSFSPNLCVANDSLYASVIDRRFTLKLEKALQNNYDYIDRKDLLTAEALLRGEVYVAEQSKTAKSSHPSIFGKYSFHQTKPGIGQSATIDTTKSTAAPKIESSSVYVSGLPRDITEEELEILFSPQGKIKKIKIYVDEKGMKKGDALINFSSSDSATIACIKLHRLDIGEGHILNVAKAEFTNKPKVAGDTTNNNKDSRDLYDKLTDEEIRQQLPIECEAECYPVLIFWNAFDPTNEDANEVETEYLLACCPHGNVRVIQLLPLFVELKSQNEGGSSSTSKQLSIVVTFETIHGATKCCEVLQGKLILNKSLHCRLLSASNSDSNNSSKQEESIAEEAISQEAIIAVPVTVVENLMMQEATITALHLEEEGQQHQYDEAKIQEEVDNVEDFLNSLL